MSGDGAQSAALLAKQLKGKQVARAGRGRALSACCGSQACFVCSHLPPKCSPTPRPPDLTKNPNDYFSAGLVREDNMYEWEMMVVGPPETL